MMEIGALIMPILMVIGAIAVWRMPKREGRRNESEKTWRDSSLDDWRAERDAALETERQARVANGGTIHQGAGNTEESEPVRHQRIGG